MGRLTLAALAALAIAGCSLTVSTSGLSGGAADATDGSAAEGGGSLGDSSTVDAPADALLGTTDAAVSPCAQQHVFCDDFDTNDDVTGRWTSMKSLAGPITLDTTHPRSPPRSLRMSVQRGTAKRASEIRKDLTFKTSLLHVDLDLFVGAPSGTDYLEVDPIEVALYPAPPGYEYQALSIAIYPDATRFEYYKDQAGGANPILVQQVFTLPRGAWVHVTIVADFLASPAKGRILIDGNVLAEMPLGSATLESVSVGVGATFTEAANVDWSIDFDNVVVN